MAKAPQMSPFTELAENLSCLSTTCSTVTPRRKVSWSDLKSPHVRQTGLIERTNNADCLKMESPLLRKRRVDARRNFRSFSVSYTSFNVNNVSDAELASSCSSSHSPVKKDDQHFDSGSDAESQDSGFFGCFAEKISATTSSTGPSVRSTVFMDEDTDDGFMHMFDLDSVDENSNVPNVLTGLFTKPICRTNATDEIPQDTNRELALPVKKKMCRRLSMTTGPPLGKAASISTSPILSCLLKEKAPRRRNSDSPAVSVKVNLHNKSKECSEDSENCSKCANCIDVTSRTSKRSPFKRPEPPEHLSPVWNKRQKFSPLKYHTKLQLTSTKRPGLQRCFSESEASIMKALQKSDEHPDLIGDFSKPYILPMIKGRHQDLKTVTPETGFIHGHEKEIEKVKNTGLTMITATPIRTDALDFRDQLHVKNLSQLMTGVFNNSMLNYTVVDCRYPYEFEGGHIQGARNIYTREGIVNGLLSNVSQPHNKEKRNIVVFHCEFSSERAPNLCRFLRNQDRECNKDTYPQLCHPEVYLLEGGYKAFFENYKELCDPQHYTPMLHKDHEIDLRHFREKSKSWSGGQQKKRSNLRMGRKFKVV